MDTIEATINDLGYIAGGRHYDDETQPTMPVLHIKTIDRAVRNYTDHGAQTGYAEPIEQLLNYDL